MTGAFLQSATVAAAAARRPRGIGAAGRLAVFALAAVLALLSTRPAAQAATLPSGFGEALVASGLSSPTAMAFAPDGRLFVAEQGGRLRVIKNGTLLSQPFVTLSVDSSGERGLLGVAFDPNFATNQYVYVYYTTSTSPKHNRVVRFTANGDIAAGGETLILRLNDLTTATNHNGGAIHFGTDGKLYIAVGDNATSANAQSKSNLLGKILRINPDGSIPTDNPFSSDSTVTGNNKAIWALGLRNPFSFAVQPGTGRIFINDVGQSTWEEINDGIKGANYGWPDAEGPTSDPRFVSPIYAYRNDSSTCAIAGGAFYNPPTNQFPSEYSGDYFFADYCGGWIKRFDPVSGTVSDFASGISYPVDLQVASDGSIYYLARGGGAVYRVRYSAGGQAPSITQHPASQTVTAGQSVTFNVTASGTAPLNYQWQRNSANIPGATSSSYTIASVTTADNGAQFRAVVSNAYGSATSNAATLTVTGTSAPTAAITAPAEGALYSAGDTIQYAGTGNDPEDGDLPASAFTWRVDFHHDTHTHPFVPDTSGATSGSFTIPTSGETATNVFYRIHLTVRDSGGLTHSTYRDVKPRTVHLTVSTSPTGLQVKVDGQPRTAPVSVQSVVGMTRTLGAVSAQTVRSITYEFQSWSDGGAATHDITTPAANTTYTATYRRASASPTPTPTPTSSPSPTPSPSTSPVPSPTQTPPPCPPFCR